MKKWVFVIVPFFLAIASALFFTYAWYNTLVLIPFSETLWTFFNNILPQGSLPSAADFEFLTVLLGSLALFYFIFRYFIANLIKLKNALADFHK